MDKVPQNDIFVVAKLSAPTCQVSMGLFIEVSSFVNSRALQGHHGYGYDVG